MAGLVMVLLTLFKLTLSMGGERFTRGVHKQLIYNCIQWVMHVVDLDID